METLDNGYQFKFTCTHVHSFIYVRSFARFCPAHITVYPTFQFNLFHFGCVDISDPSFFTKYYLQHLYRIWCGVVWHVRYIIRSPIRWSLVCSVAWLVVRFARTHTHTHDSECVNFQPFFPIFNGSAYLVGYWV